MENLILDNDNNESENDKTKTVQEKTITLKINDESEVLTENFNMEDITANNKGINEQTDNSKSSKKDLNSVHDEADKNNKPNDFVESQVHQKFVCFMCNLEIGDCDLKDHMIKEHGVEINLKQNNCPQCEWSSYDKNKLSQHMKNLHYVKCNECNELFNNATTLSNHMTTAHMLQCESCDYSFLNKEISDKHMKTIHPAEVLVICGECGKFYRMFYSVVDKYIYQSGVAWTELRPHCLASRSQTVRLREAKQCGLNSSSSLI